MPSCRFDVLGLGNAIVDVISRTDDDFLAAQGLRKGAMTLIDEARAEALYKAMGPATIASGGSAANTIIGAASLGCRAAFIGKLKDDETGAAFAHDIRAANVDFSIPFAKDGPASGRCLVLVTPDGHRTMNTFLGAAQNLSEADVDEDLVKQSAIVYLEGYLWDPPAAKAAFVKAAKIAQGAGRRVALTLSDSFCVDRYREEFLGLIRSGSVQIVFANESELHSLYQTGDFDTAAAQLRTENILAVVTRSERGIYRRYARRGSRRARLPSRPGCRHDGRWRSVRRWISRRAQQKQGPRNLREAWRPRRSRDHPAHRRAAAQRPRPARRAERARDLI